MISINLQRPCPVCVPSMGEDVDCRSAIVHARFRQRPHVFAQTCVRNPVEWARVCPRSAAGITRDNVLHSFRGVYYGACMSIHEENTGSATTRDLAAMGRLGQFYNPMAAIHWTFWQALAWVRDRDINAVLECSEPYRWFVGTFREIWREDSFETSRALASLCRTLEAGTLIATGIDSTSGTRREIRPLEWCDLQLVGIGLAAPELYRRGSSTADLATLAKPEFRELLVRREEVLRAFAESADLEAELREALHKNPKLTQSEASKIARNAGAIEPRDKIREMLKSLGGSTKPGPHGPRKNRAGPAA